MGVMPFGEATGGGVFCGHCPHCWRAGAPRRKLRSVMLERFLSSGDTSACPCSTFLPRISEQLERLALAAGELYSQTGE